MKTCLVSDELSAVLRQAMGDKPAKAVADDMGIRVGYLRNATNPDDETKHFQLGWLVPFMQSTGSVLPLRHIASQVGFGLYRLPAAGVTARELLTDLASATSELGDVSRASLDCTDGATFKEKHDLILQTRQLMDACAVLLAKAESLAPVDRPQPVRMQLQYPKSQAVAR